MKELFADTSGWGSLLDPRQRYHAEAKSIFEAAQRLRRTVVTTSYVLSELVALLTNPLRIARPKVIQILEGLRCSPIVEVVHVDSTLEDAAWQMFSSHADKTWSLVDCVSFALMRARGIQEALASDRHFEQAGFTRLLR